MHVPVVAVEGTIARNETCESEADVTFQLGDMVIDIECKRQCSSRQRAMRPPPIAILSLRISSHRTTAR